jgi:HSP20 family protein
LDDFPSRKNFDWNGSDRFSPSIDVFERDGKFVVRVDLPGLSKEDVTVDVTDNFITIEGERKYEREDDQEGVYRSERGYGRFLRRVPLPKGVKPDTATANFKNGVLEVKIEAEEMSKSHRRIDIQAEEFVQKSDQAAA